MNELVSIIRDLLFVASIGFFGIITSLLLIASLLFARRKS